MDKRRKFVLISLVMILLVVVLTACGGRTPYWSSESPDESVVETAIWELAIDGDLNLDEEAFILSISPSGNYILVSLLADYDLTNRRYSNVIGKEAEYLALYSKEDGMFTLVERIDIEIVSGYRWNDIVVSANETSIAWNEDETQILLTAGKPNAFTPSFLMSGFSSVFLVDFDQEVVEDVTSYHSEPVDLIDGGHADFLPQWVDQDTISFVRYTLDAEERLVTHLVRMNLQTGEEEVIADLPIDDPSALISGYVIHEEVVYFTTLGVLWSENGFFFVDLRDEESSPTLLISGTDAHDNSFISIEISSDERWALLTILDNRIITRDIPLADNPEYPQPDPGSAVSMITGQPWIPYHNVILFDLSELTIIDPFIDSALIPTEVIVTAATFAPDGKSLLCTVFGDGDVWTLASHEETSIWQISLGDDSFEARRIFRTEFDFSLAARISWLGDHSVWMRPGAWMIPPSFSPHLLVVPAAFEGIYD